MNGMMRRNGGRSLAVLTVALAVATSTVTFTTTASEAQSTYGAFAYSPAQHSVVAAGSGQTPVSAQDYAIAQCRRRAKDCLPVTWYRNAYAAFVVGAGTAWAWGRSGISPGDADERALSFCRAHGGGMQCRVILRGATSSPSVSAQAGEDLVGRVCMVFAPSGANFGILGKYGHVGWAYLIDRDRGSWFWGANEGPSLDRFGVPSRTWRAGGLWAGGAALPSLVTSFRTAGNYHAANYYQYVRCSSGPWHNPTSAAATAAAQQQQPYRVPNNDCLSNTVDIFRAYGVPQLPSYINTPQPNVYFQTAISRIARDKSSFEPMRKIELR